MEFYKVLESLMKNRNLSIPDIARATGLSDSTLRSIISRKTKNISLEVAFKLSQGLNVSLEELNGDKEISRVNSSTNYSEEEQQHIEDLRKLNTEGKDKVITYTKDLIEMPKYQKENNVTAIPKRKKQIWEEPGKEYLMPIACHDDNLTDEEKDFMDEAIAEYERTHKK
ncbi:helix-turn-helix transcriptional regulator [Clostridium perfringens]|nr:helix-turn-helix transcriptional regulator [Clostridium perfringens]WEV14833.1 helix-turn-helix transcriptional regulator [Clostridium perfringens D]